MTVSLRQEYGEADRTERGRVTSPQMPAEAPVPPAQRPESGGTGRHTTGKTPIISGQAAVDPRVWIDLPISLVGPSHPRNAEGPELASNELGAFVIG